MSNATALLDAEAIESYRRDGAIVVRGAFDAATLAELERGIDENLADPSPRGIVASRPEDPGWFFEDFCNWDRIGAYEAFIRDSPAAAIAAALMGAGTVRLYHDHLLVKEPGTTQQTPWHQDQPYYNVEGRQVCSMWLPIDPVSEAATLRFVAGSHLGPWLMPRTFLAGEARWFPDGALQELPDIDGDPAAHRLLAWALEPGDAVFFHMLTLHAAGGVEPGRRRRAFSVRFLGDDAVHAPRRWTTSPAFPGLADELPAGAPMVGARFPILWQGDPA